MRRRYASVASTLRTVGFVLRVMPMRPSRRLVRRSPESCYEPIVVPRLDPRAPAEHMRPPTPGPHAGVVVCLGVIPFDATHPHVRRLGRALARRGFATLIVWSPAMRSLRIDPDDTSHLAAAFD